MTDGQFDQCAEMFGRTVEPSKTLAIYYISIVLLYVNFIVGCVPLLSFIEPFTPALTLASSVLLSYRILTLYKNCPLKSLLIPLICITVGGLSFLRCGESNMLLLMLLIFGLGDVDGRIVLNLWTGATCLVLMCMVALAALAPLTGLEPMTVVRQASGATRYGLYFIHPNTFGMVLTMLAISISMVWGKSSRLVDIACVLLVVIAYGVTDSKGALISGVVYFALKVMPSKFWLGLSGCLLRALPVLCIGFVFLITIGAFDSHIFDLMQAALTGRPALWQFQYKHVGLTMFGQRAIFGAVDYGGWHYSGITIDSAYASYLVYTGLASFLAFQYLYHRGLCRAAARKDYRLLAALVAMVLLGIVESSAVNPMMATPLILLGSYYGPCQR